MENDFGKWLKLKLIETGMSQKEFAKKIGTTASSVSYYANGKRKPSGTIYAKIAEIFGAYTTRKEARSITLRQLLYYMTEGSQKHYPSAVALLHDGRRYHPTLL